MHRPLFRDETLVEYFKGLVDAALQNQHVCALDLTGYYLVQLLAGFGRTDRPAGPAADEPLALRLGRALEAGGSRQRRELKTLGDESLFVAGFFSDSLRRRLVDVDYYASLGGYAYGSLSQADADVLAPVFAELADRFIAFADVLSEVSEASHLTSDTDLLRLYDRWSRGGSRRSGELLARRGVVPNAQAIRPLVN
jgi:hypothetical protein